MFSDCDISKCETKIPYLADVKSFEEHALLARSTGKEVLIASDYQLFLDLDFMDVGRLKRMFTSGSYQQLPRPLPHDIISDVLENNYVSVLTREFTRSSSSNIHGILTLDTALDEPVRIALEVCLGSDPKRGALNAIRYSLGLRGGSRLFRPLPLVRIEI